VVDTGSDLSLPSQYIVLFLIQLGGLGVMTAATSLSLVWGSRIGIRQRLLIKEGFGLDTPQGAVRLVLWVVRFTIVIETAGALVLFAGFLGTHGIFRAAYMAVFHSISAFCNAGFSPISDSLTGYQATWMVPGAVMFLVFVGGLGFIPLLEIWSRFRGGRNRPLSVHTRLVLTISLWLVAIGTVLFAVSEWMGTLEGLPFAFRIWNSLFHSITPRTAGFNTLDTSSLSSAGVLLTCILMIIGASPGSTGGGIKTTSLGVLLAVTSNELRGGGEVTLWNRRLPVRIIKRTLSLLVVYLGTILAGTGILLLLEPFGLRDVVFEVISALGTVGLSTGITPHLSDPGKLVLVMLMFWGRVGLITFMYALVDHVQPAMVSYTDTNIPVG
jgi:trk system potassium uptake protein TrkH